MVRVVPPYMHELITILEKELLLAEKKEIKAKKAYESATEYRQLCEEKLNEAKHDEEIKG